MFKNKLSSYLDLALILLFLFLTVIEHLYGKEIRVRHGIGASEFIYRKTLSG